MYYVYVVYNSANSVTYTGQTEDLDRRINEHNEHKYKGFTSRYRGEWILIYNESVATRSDALKREKQLKSGSGREFIKQYIPT
jgi:putative endonuclease